MSDAKTGDRVRIEAEIIQVTEDDGCLLQLDSGQYVENVSAHRFINPSEGSNPLQEAIQWMPDTPANRELIGYNERFLGVIHGIIGCYTSQAGVGAHDFIAKMPRGPK